MGLFSGLLGNAGVIDPRKIQEDFGRLFTEDEQIEIGFKIVRDVIIFTNKRLIMVNKQGVTGKKVEYYSVAYGSISRFSVESSGHFDLEAELKIWISSEAEPSITKTFDKKVDIYEVQKILASYVL
jgi:hypothetical protein